VDDLQKDRQIARTTVMTVMDNLYQGVAERAPGRPGRWDRTGTAARDPDRVQPTWPSADVTQVMRHRW